MVTLAAIAVLVVAVIAVPRRPPAPSAADSSEGPERQESATEVAPNPPPIAPAHTLAAYPSTKTVASAFAAAPLVREPSKNQSAQKPLTNRSTESAQSARSAAPVAAAAPMATAAEKEDSAIERPVSEPMRTAPASAAVSTASVPLSPVTITGCLEIRTDDDAFRLTDTEGVDAPKARSWRTGYLTKRSAAVALVDAPDPLALKTNVGKRVAATGLLTSHELRVNSLRVVGPSCN